MTHEVTALDDLSTPDETRAHGDLRSTRPFYWSVMREVWEHRAIYIVPLIVASFVLFAMFSSSAHIARRIRAAQTLDAVQRHVAVVTPFSMLPAPIILVTLLVAAYYSLEAFRTERRDRSILFWKSLPVSDRTTVLAKAAIPLCVVPAIAVVIGYTAQVVFVVFASVVLTAGGGGATLLWSEFRFVNELLILIYGVFVHVLWFAPIYCWLLLVSAWVRRAAFLWAVLPLFIPLAIEGMLFRTHYFGTFVQHRLDGAMNAAFIDLPKKGAVIDQLSILRPLNFFTTPGLWIGLAFSAAFIAAAIRLRRHREPV